MNSRIPIHKQSPRPFALFGYAWATLVGMIWGGLLSTGSVRRHGKLWVFSGLPKWSFRRGGVCVGACYLTDTNVNRAVLRHEDIHRQQWRVLGLMLPVRYFLAGNNPLHNRFEIEAGLADGGYRSR
jgi:hypothetical protein